MFKKRPLAAAVPTALVGVLVLLAGLQAQAASLTLLHNNDGESKLFGDANFGGAAFFATTVGNLRSDAANLGRDALLISSGDNFLAGAAFNASLGSGTPGNRTFYDALALQQLNYDALTIGNHEFDFGPDILAEFITYYNDQGGTAPFLSANLDFSGETSLQNLVSSADIAKSTVVTKNGTQYGIIGVTTPNIAIVSNPGNVVANPVLGAIQQEVTNLENQGVNKIILSSHLQQIGNEIDLAGNLSGVDVIIAGGGDELLINQDNARNTVAQADGPYPVVATDMDGNNVAIVTTVGEYLYVGKLDVEFDDATGLVTNVSGEPVAVDKNVVAADPTMQTTVIDPLNAAIDAANSTVIATTDVFLEHSDGNTDGPRVIRERETNLGDLVADAFVFAVENEGSGLTAGNTLIGLTNAGGIREDLDNDEDGNITQGEAFGVLPFPNTMAVIGNVDVDTLVVALENAVSAIQPDGTGTDGRFAQISGFEFDFNPGLAAGSRVQQVRLTDGTLVWTAVAGALINGLFDIATNSFLAAEGTPDGYDFGDADRNILSTGYADALIAYITQALGGEVSGAMYPLAGLGRINAVPLPATAWLMAAGLLPLVRACRRRVEKTPT